MGTDKNSDRRKCGEIFINIKTIKNKVKMFKFHCAVCSIDCGQFKKFSKHLECHLDYFENDLEILDEQVKDQYLLFEPEEIKVEIMAEIDKGNFDIANDIATAKQYVDPLETEKCSKNDMKDVCNSEEVPLGNIKQEDNSDRAPGTYDNANSMSCNSSSEILEVPKVETKSMTSKKRPYSRLIDFSSDDSSHFASDPDFEAENDVTTSKNIKILKKVKRKSERKKSAKEPVEAESNLINKLKRSKRRWRKIDESKLPIIIEMYKKYEVLWQVNDIAFGIQAKRYEIFDKIIEELKSQHNVDQDLDELLNDIDFINFIFYKNKEQELKCELDKTEFKPSSRLYKELSFLSNSQGPFKCANCNEIIKKYDHYKIHVAQHSGSIPFQCRLCEMGFRKFENYLRHVTRHLGINSYHCDVCGKGYPLKAELDWHLTSHTGVKPYLCPICGVGFRARHGYDNHIRRHEKRFRYECHICKHGFNHLCKLNTHIKSHLNIRDVICNVCGKGFTAAKYLQRHKLIHEVEKRYKCNICGKAFAQDSGLRTHRKQHQPYATTTENKNLLNKCI